MSVTCDLCLSCSQIVPAACLWFPTWWWPPGLRPRRRKPGRKWPTGGRRLSPSRSKLAAAWSTGWTEGETHGHAEQEDKEAEGGAEVAEGEADDTWQCSTSSGKTWMTDFGPPWAPKRSSSSMASRAACEPARHTQINTHVHEPEHVWYNTFFSSLQCPV